MKTHWKHHVLDDTMHNSAHIGNRIYVAFSQNKKKSTDLPLYVARQQRGVITEYCIRVQRLRICSGNVYLVKF
jgi:hypothetical protein